MSRLDPVSLQLFISVVEEGSIAAAAEREHIAAAAISKRISEIESTLRTPLLIRTNKGVEPTPAGMSLLVLARRALHELDDISIQMRDHSSGVRGLVRVFASMSAITRSLPLEIKAYHSRYPQVQVRLEEKISSAVTRGIAENSADIGIFAMPLLNRELEVFPYISDRLMLITPAGHPLSDRKALSFSETLDYEHVGLSAGSAIDLQLFKAASEQQRTLNMTIRVTSCYALCLMVNADLGIGVLPETVVTQYTGALNIRMIPLTDAWSYRDLKICVRSFEALPVAARLLVRHLQKNAGLTAHGGLEAPPVPLSP